MAIESNASYNGGILRDFYVHKTEYEKGRIGTLLFLRNERRIGVIKNEANSKEYIAIANVHLNTGSIIINKFFSTTTDGKIQAKKLKTQLISYPKTRNKYYKEKKRRGSGNDDIAIALLMLFYVLKCIWTENKNFTIIK